jgi:hypothetical protein
VRAPDLGRDLGVELGLLLLDVGMPKVDHLGQSVVQVSQRTDLTGGPHLSEDLVHLLVLGHQLVKVCVGHPLLQVGEEEFILGHVMTVGVRFQTLAVLPEPLASGVIGEPVFGEGLAVFL